MNIHDEVTLRNGDAIECPLCGNEIFIGVHDSEGNYQGKIGCQYEQKPWSGLSYAAHHEEYGECLLCSDGLELPMGGCLFDTLDEAIEAISKLFARLRNDQ